MTIVMEVGQHLFCRCCHFGERVGWLHCVFVFVVVLAPEAAFFWVVGSLRHLSCSRIASLVQRCLCLGGGVFILGQCVVVLVEAVLFVWWHCCFGRSSSIFGWRVPRQLLSGSSIALLARAVFSVLVWGAASLFWGWCVVVLADGVFFIWWRWHHGQNVNFVLYETVLHKY